jgi:hypothetical protein
MNLEYVRSIITTDGDRVCAQTRSAGNALAATVPCSHCQRPDNAICPDRRMPRVASLFVVVSILGPRHAPRRQEIYLVRGRAAHHFLHIAEIVKLVE